jgi:hypothetical protein
MKNILKSVLFFCIFISLPILYSCEYLAEKTADCVFFNSCPKPNISPKETIKTYYQNINLRKYPEAWTMLSPRFQKAVSKDDYNDYQQWWDKVASVEVGSITLVRESENVAIVNADLTYKMRNGKEIKDSKTEIFLSKDSSSRWLIDRKY